MAEQTLLKDQLAGPEVAQLADQLIMAAPSIDIDGFRTKAMQGLDKLELKQRVQHIIAALHDYLPSEFENTATILLNIGDRYQQPDQASWGAFAAWPLIDYVAEAGINHPELALKVLKALTALFSSEFAIRPFIEQHFELTYKAMLQWAEDDNEHVRRLASEGIRPRLPWGKRLHNLCRDPSVIFPILEKLKDDENLYVRKSVANNLNDISKDNPDLVIECCQRWLSDATDERRWIIRHGLRSLIKAGRPEVFPLLGYSEQPAITIDEFSLSADTLKFGEMLTINVNLTSQQQQKLVLDYKVHYVKANGQLSAKVFKWKNLDLSEQQTVSLNKTHPFKAISTRRYYAGEHKVELLVNGKPVNEVVFELVI